MMQSVDDLVAQQEKARKKIFAQVSHFNFWKFGGLAALTLVAVLVILTTLTAFIVFPNIIRQSSNEDLKKFVSIMDSRYLAGDVVQTLALQGQNSVQQAAADDNEPLLIDSKYCPAPHQNAKKQSRLTLFLISFFVGSLGVDRFMLGYIAQGVFKLLTFGGLGVWWMVDWVLITNYQLTQKNGCPLYNDMKDLNK